MKIGYLDYKYFGKRAGNIGQDIFLSHITYDVSPVTPEKAMELDILLVSIPSTFQYVDYVKTALKYQFDKRNKTIIIIGGYGAINPYFLDGLFDYFVLGRVHTKANEIIEQALTRSLAKSDNVVTPDTYGMTKRLCQDSMTGNESFVGCKYKCKFCQYSHIRKRQGFSTEYVQNLLTKGNSPEIMFKSILDLNSKPGRIRTAIDGYSNRLRKAYGKKITNEAIVDAISHLGNLAKNKKPVVMTLYNITNFPGETPEDYKEFVNTINSIKEPNGRVIIAVCSMTFRPSPLTPMEYLQAGTFPSIIPLRTKTIRDTKNLLVKHSYTLEGPTSAMNCVLIERCNLDMVSVIRDAILKPKVGSLKSEDKAKAVLDKYKLWEMLGNVESLPTDFLEKPYKNKVCALCSGNLS
jgi:hypothetical protein